MSGLCDYVRDGEWWVCAACGRQLAARGDRPPRRVCRSQVAAAGSGESTPREALLLKCHLSPGDVLTLTAAIESLHATYPGQYTVYTDTTAPALFDHNPHVAGVAGEGGGCCPPKNEARAIDCHYPSIHQSNQRLTPFLAGYTEHLGDVLGRPLRLTTNRPHLYLSDREREWPLPAGLESGKFWLVCAGVKSDFPLKQWPVESYQAVVDYFRGQAMRFVQVGAAEHDHVPLDGVVNLIGRTTLRQLVRLAWHAAGGLGPVTFLQHLCAAWQKPYVCLVGGREPAAWVTYPKQTTLHTIGALDCCRDGACWRSTLDQCAQPVGDGPLAGLDAGKHVELQRPVGRCMTLIEPQEVVRAIELFLVDPNEKRLELESKAELAITANKGGAARAEARGTQATGYSSARIDWLPLLTLPEPLSLDSAPRLVARVVEALEAPAFAYPENAFEGRGIVTCAGGDRYLTCAYVLIRSLRDLGCVLPIEVWHLGPEELASPVARAIEDLAGVNFFDAHRLRDEFFYHPRLNGWEVKPYAIRFSRFEEVLFLDADNVPAVDPTYLFDDEEYARTGAICWPDFGRFTPRRTAWRAFGDVPYRDEPEHETGQLLIHKRKVWRAVLLANWFNAHSAFYYDHNLGDKDTWHMAFRRLGMEFAMPGRPIEALDGTMCQHDLQGRRLFQHRNGAKWVLPTAGLLDRPLARTAYGNRRVHGFLREEECLAYLGELAEMIHQQGGDDA